MTALVPDHDDVETHHERPMTGSAKQSSAAKRDWIARRYLLYETARDFTDNDIDC
jgi:hypothetical protein